MITNDRPNSGMGIVPDRRVDSCVASPRSTRSRLTNQLKKVRMVSPGIASHGCFTPGGSGLFGFRTALTISRAAPATAPTIPPTQANNSAGMTYSEAPTPKNRLKMATPSPVPSPAVSNDQPTILTTTAMYVSFRSRSTDIELPDDEAEQSKQCRH